LVVELPVDREAIMMPGDPTPKSPCEVLRDRAYRFIESSAHGPSVQLTVLHCGTETYWQTFYGMMDDQLPAQWFQVKRVVVKRIEFHRVR
jgi:hypothetical protein